MKKKRLLPIVCSFILAVFVSWLIGTCLTSSPEYPVLSLEDGFVAEDEKGRGWTGGLIGGLAGLLGGPVGVLVGMGAGALIGNAADETGM